MKYLKTVAVMAVMLIVGACSGTATYNPEKIKEVTQKEELSDADYEFLTDQMIVITKSLESNQKTMETETDEAKKKEMMNDPQLKEMALTGVGLGVMLQQAEKKGELPESCVKKLEKFKAEQE